MNVALALLEVLSLPFIEKLGRKFMSVMLSGSHSNLKLKPILRLRLLLVLAELL